MATFNYLKNKNYLNDILQSYKKLIEFRNNLFIENDVLISMLKDFQ